MHDLVKRINDPQLCYVFAKNAANRGHPELAIQSYRRAVDLRTLKYETHSEAEEAAVRAIYAYEEALSYAKGKRTRATGTWQLVNRKGLLPALAQRIESRTTPDVLPVLEKLGMADYSFAATMKAHPKAFEAAAV
jgi:hypothetical protein